MANIWENAIITNKGISLQAKVMAGGEIELTSIKVGAGSVPIDRLAVQTAVSNIKQTATVNGFRRTGNTAIIPVYLTNEGVTQAYDLYQVGFYANDPDEGEILYAIAQCTTPKHIPTETEMPLYSLTWNFHFTMSNEQNLTVNIASALYVTREEFNKHVDESEDKYAPKKAPVFTESISLGRKEKSIVGTGSVAIGIENTASGDYSYAEGGNVTASGYYSHAEGVNTVASEVASHAEGYDTKANGQNSHAEGYQTETTGSGAHAEGYKSVASGYASHAEGQSTKASDISAHAEGYNTEATGLYTHAEGYFTKATSSSAHAEGFQTEATGEYSHAEGCQTKASGERSHAEGYNTEALANQHAQGHYNDTSKATAGTNSGTSDGTAFVVGNGTPDAASNAFRITYKGQPLGKLAYGSTGADVAELREWLDGNPENEDRRGYFITMDGMYIKKAAPGDFICGIISANPCLIGNSDEDWMGRYVFDDFGAFVYEEVEITEEKTGKKSTCTHYKTNPEYDPTRPYIQRQDRPEWDYVGLCGVINTRDDGTCEINGFCKCGENGVATKADRGYRVVDRVNDHIVKVLFFLTGEIF